MENDNASEGIQFLTRLVNTYGDSHYIPDARLLMAEHYFENDLLIAARQNYDEVLGFPNSSVYNYALYKVAWVDINEYMFEDALTRFQSVVSNLDISPDPSLDFRRQALNDMLKCYVELDNGWVRARDYYESYEGEDLMRRQLARLGNAYDEQGKNEERIEVLSFFWDRYPNDEQIPQWAADLRDSYEKIGNWDRLEDGVRGFIAYMRPGTPWYVANGGNDRSLINASGYSHDWLLQIINRNYTEAERLCRNQPDICRALYQECAVDYSNFFEWFPESVETYDQSFFYAELLYYKLAHDSDETYPGCSDDHYMGFDQCDDWLADAGFAYQRVVELDPTADAEHAHDSAVGALQVYDDFMKRAVPNIDDPLPPPAEMEDWAREQLATYGPELDGGRVDPEPTPMTDYVDIVSWFAQLYPEDDLIPAASWRAAGLYLRHNKIAEAAQRFETIIEHHPTHRFAQQAAFGAFVCYNAVEDWVNIEHVARMLLEPCSEAADQEICEPGRLASAIAYAMNNQSEDLMDEGNGLRDAGDVRGSRVLYLQAAEKRVALYREFPDSEWSPNALYNAAATFEAARDVDESISLYNEYITVFGEHENVPDAMFTLGLIQDSQARFPVAAGWFERVAETYPDSPDASSAVLNAARLREALSEYDQSLALYTQYMALEPESEINNDLYFIMAEMEQGRGNQDAAFDRYQSFLNDVTDDSIRRLIAVHRQAKIREGQDRESDALTLYTQIYNMYGPGEMGFNEENQPQGWVTEPGANFTGDERLAVLPFAAEARFMLSEEAFTTARGTTIGDWQSLTEDMDARFASMAEAQKELYAVDAFGDASWAIAARSRIGELFYDFYKELIQLDPPDFDECLEATRYNYDVCDDAMEQFDEAVFNGSEQLRNRAEVAWVEARSAAVENNVFNEWVLHTIELMNDLDRAYAVGLTEGMTADSAGDAYLSTGYILDLGQKLEDFADFVELPAEGTMFDEFGNPIPAALPTPGAAPAGQMLDGESEALEDAGDALEGADGALEGAIQDTTDGEVDAAEQAIEGAE
ncbi:MAG: TolA-binding protein [Bradymonadia bacterium]|jgi:TolA-binding protein